MRKTRPTYTAATLLSFFTTVFFCCPKNLLAAPETEPPLVHQSTYIFPLLLLCLILFSFLLFKIRTEKKRRHETEQILTANHEQIKTYSQQMDQFALAAASMFSMEDESAMFKKIADSITTYSDYDRVMISLFKDDYPHREIIGYSGLGDETVRLMTRTALSKSYFEKICQLAEKIGQFSYYVPYNKKHIFNQDAILYGEGESPTEKSKWHPQDNLLVNMRDHHGNFIGVISVDNSKSGLRPTAEIVRPLEIFASFISQIILTKRGQQKQQDLQEQLNQIHHFKSFGNMAGGIAQDFNNTLGLILGNADLALLHSEPESQVHTNLQAIKKAGTQAKDIVQQLLSFSQKNTREFKPNNIVTTIEETINFLRSTIPSTIEVQQNIQTNEALISTDPNQFGQLLINISSNSTDAMDAKGGILTISINTLQVKPNTVGVPGDISEGHWAKIVISDTGTGIKEDIIHQIFDPGFTTKLEMGNKGMGLTQVKDLVDKHNGRITVSSSHDFGTTFSLYLPLYQKQEMHDVLLEKPMLVGTEKILFIDDDDSLLSLGKLMLEQLGYRVQAENDPLAAIRYFEENSSDYDLVITDMTMPQMTGDVLARKLLAIDPEAKIILCTGYSDIISKEEAIGLGIKGYYEKPLTIQPFSKIIRSVLGQDMV